MLWCLQQRPRTGICGIPSVQVAYHYSSGDRLFLSRHSLTVRLEGREAASSTCSQYGVCEPTESLSSGSGFALCGGPVRCPRHRPSTLHDHARRFRTLDRYVTFLGSFDRTSEALDLLSRQSAVRTPESGDGWGRRPCEYWGYSELRSLKVVQRGGLVQLAFAERPVAGIDRRSLELTGR
jgi:hypothetical protein